MWRVLLRTQAVAANQWCGFRRSSSSNISDSGSDSRKSAKSGSEDDKSSFPDSGNPISAGEASRATEGAESGRGKEEYSIPTAEIFQAVRRCDFNAFQSHAVDIVQHKWREEHSIPAACILFFLLTWYCASSARRRAERSRKATEARVKEEAEQTIELVGSLVRKWRQDVQRADQQLQLILDKNGELTKDIDRMTAALRQCYISTPSDSGTQMRNASQE